MIYLSKGGGGAVPIWTIHGSAPAYYVQEKQVKKSKKGNILNCNI